MGNRQQLRKEVRDSKKAKIADANKRIRDFQERKRIEELQGHSVKNGTRLNLYNCPKCGASIITTDRVVGTTPFLVPCKSYGSKNCDGMMRSLMYNVPHTLTPYYEWVTPDNKDDKILKLKKIRKKSNK